MATFFPKWLLRVELAHGPLPARMQSETTDQSHSKRVTICEGLSLGRRGDRYRGVFGISTQNHPRISPSAKPTAWSRG